MNDIQLKERIKSLSFSTIINMSHDGLAVLTNKFQEPLVRELMYSATTNSRQRVLFKYLKEAYKKWMKENEPMWGGLFGERYPEYMDKMQLDIECGMIVTKDGAVPDPAPDKAPADTTTHVLNTISSVFGLSSRTPSPETSNTTNLRIRALEQKNRELEAIIAHKNAELEQRIEDYMKAHSMTKEDINAICSDDAVEVQPLDNNEEVLALQERVKELEEENRLIPQLKLQLEELQDISESFMSSSLDDTQVLTLHQKIVFFVTVTSVILDKRYTHLGNFASLIAIMCNENQKVIGPKLSRIANIEKHPELKKTLHLAAQSVSDLLANTLTDATKNDRHQVINKIRENLLLNFPSPEDE